MLLYAVRHAESQANVDRSAGLNSPLTPLGERQAVALADRLESAGLKAVYASPFLRCIQTAAAVADRVGLPIHIRPDLCEHHHLPAGSPDETGLEGVDSLCRRHPQLRPCPDHRSPFDWVPVDETLGQLVDRMRLAARFFKTRYTADDDAVLLVSHGSPIARLVDGWLTDTEGPSFRFIIDNAAINALRYHAGLSSLICLNERSHLINLPVPGAANFDAAGGIKPLPPTSY